MGKRWQRPGFILVWFVLAFFGVYHNLVWVAVDSRQQHHQQRHGTGLEKIENQSPTMTTKQRNISNVQSPPLQSTIFSESQLQSQRSPRFAYAYLAAGCTLTSCNGYVLYAIVASAILKHHKSKADIVFMVRMTGGDDTISKLSDKHERWLQKAGIYVEYLPKIPTDNFATVTLAKFRILELTQYDRVYFLDSDLIPLCNIDYHMEASNWKNSWHFRGHVLR